LRPSTAFSQEMSGWLFRDIVDLQQLAGLLAILFPNGVQGVAGSNPAVPTVVSGSPATVYVAGLLRVRRGRVCFCVCLFRGSEPLANWGMASFSVQPRQRSPTCTERKYSRPARPAPRDGALVSALSGEPRARLLWPRTRPHSAPARRAPRPAPAAPPPRTAKQPGSSCVSSRSHGQGVDSGSGRQSPAETNAAQKYGCRRAWLSSISSCTCRSACARPSPSRRRS
jgi:hypothetical protein